MSESVRDRLADLLMRHREAWVLLTPEAATAHLADEALVAGLLRDEPEGDDEIPAAEPVFYIDQGTLDTIQAINSKVFLDVEVVLEDDEPEWEQLAKLSEIRERDRNAVARIGNPEADPLLRAEMDRRLLLAAVEAVLALHAPGDPECPDPHHNPLLCPCAVIYCDDCGDTYPCRTVAAIREQLEVTHDYRRVRCGGVQWPCDEYRVITEHIDVED